MEIEFEYCSHALTLLCPFWFYISGTNFFFFHVCLHNFMCAILLDKKKPVGMSAPLCTNCLLPYVLDWVTVSFENGTSLFNWKNGNSKSNLIFEYYWLTWIQMSVWSMPRNTYLWYKEVFKEQFSWSDNLLTNQSDYNCCKKNYNNLRLHLRLLIYGKFLVQNTNLLNSIHWNNRE